MKKYIPLLIIIFAFMGIADSAYLTMEHYSGRIPPCNPNAFIPSDCGKVLTSEYSMMFGIPLALFGIVQYSLVLIWSLASSLTKKSIFPKLLVIQSVNGFIFSMYFVYLQLFIIKSICWYCMGSAAISTLIFIFVNLYFSRERKDIIISIVSFLYENLLKKILFIFDPEIVHVQMVRFGEFFSRSRLVREFIKSLVYRDIPILSQQFGQIKFSLPIGLAAGFDYEARLTRTLASFGFGFQTVGTITNKPYGGNPYPMLGRLPKSNSLMVNKGFKNPGSDQIISKLSPISFDIPVGISIGRTNTKDLVTQKESVEDIIQSFKKFEKSSVKHAYYELNISCPNLYGDVEFYSRKNLTELLKAVDKLKVSRPIFVKMPIDKSDKETLEILDVISKFSPVGIIIGNLQKNRNSPSLDKSEVNKWQKGNFSGKATFDDSNRLISLAYKKYKSRFIIIGCGGIFNAQDAYLKIKLGASLLQLITGMIYKGPQLIMKINNDLEKLLIEDGYKSLKEARGTITI